jgi:hypothetical protein
MGGARRSLWPSARMSGDIIGLQKRSVLVEDEPSSEAVDLLNVVAAQAVRHASDVCALAQKAASDQSGRLPF